VASITAALAAALAQMVLNYSVGKKNLATHDGLHRQTLEALNRLGSKAVELADIDARAYAALNELWKLHKADDRRVREFPAAVDAAIQAPLGVLNCALELLRLMKEIAGTTNAMLNSDLAIAAILADAACRAAVWNVRINLPLLTDAVQRSALSTRTEKSLAEASILTRAVESACAAPSA